MMATKKLYLILCWHMHQPDYRDSATGEFALPWTYLHAIKDYTDMAFHLESHPQARAVFNFVPILLDQIEDYAAQFARGDVSDPLLRLLPLENLEQLPAAQRRLILARCFASNHTNMLLPYPPYKRLYDLYQLLGGDEEMHLHYLSGQYLADLLTWYHLAWIGESVRRSHELVANLMSRGSRFTAEDRRSLFNLIGELIQGLIPRYRQLAASGQIELSATPHWHPIAPLLIDFDSARESQPSASLPATAAYPGGQKRVVFHIATALESHRRRFGAAPQGMWPAEGGISSGLAMLLAQHGCRWTASGENVLTNSLRKARHGQPPPDRMNYLYRPYRLSALPSAILSGRLEEGTSRRITCFFRDDRLSDLIGFEYAKWFGRDAINNFLHELETIWHHTPTEESPVVSVILDGENAWEYYPYNGYYFLSGLYAALEAHPFIRLTTFRDYLDLCEAGPREPPESGEPPCAEPGELPHLVAGSWVYGNFSTWIGSADKNRAWELLCAAKQSYDLVMASGRLTEEEQAAATRQLAVCEGSDWFWWFGDYNPEASVTDFDRLYRHNLENLYRLLKLPPPATLEHSVSTGGGHPEAGGAMRRAS